MKLREIYPTAPCFKLNATGKKHKLRLLNLSDEIWIDETFGEKGPNLAQDMDALSRIVFHQLEDRSPFKKQDVTFIDEDGTENIKEFGGYKLLQSQISGIEEKTEMLTAWLECIGLSRKQQNDLVKKKAM